MTKMLPFAALCAACLLSFDAAAAPAGRQSRSMQKLVEAANRGDVSAQWKLGFRYKMREDYVNAAKWFRKAAARGDASAQYQLAQCYEQLVDENGRSLTPSRAARMALSLYRKAALQGNASAQLELGRCYRDDTRGAYGDWQESLKWIRAAAEQGLPEAQVELAECYQDEWYGVNYKESAKWYRKAAELHDPRGECGLAFAYLKGQGVERDPDKAAHWALLAAKQDHPTAQLLVGSLYLDGIPKKDPAEALKWLYKAATQDKKKDAAAQAKFFIGKCYEDGVGVPRNHEEALKWYQASGLPAASKAIDRLRLPARRRRR